MADRTDVLEALKYADLFLADSGTGHRDSGIDSAAKERVTAP